jgi:putative membrane protein
MNTRHPVFVIALLAASAAGCDSQAPGSSAEAPATETAVAAEPVSAEAPALNDPQIAHIAVTANTIDVETGRLAESRTTTPAVREFAETMIRDHTAVNEQAAALAQRLGVTPQENDVSRSLQTDAAASRTQLEGLNGAAFDRAYIDREVAYHQAVLDALDKTLIPGATNDELRGLLQQVRPAVAAHLEHARSLQTTLSASR